MNKKAKTSVPILDLLESRWSPRAFSPKAVEKEKLIALFEAARWSASCFNEQPWRFIVGQKENETFKKIFATLADGNQVWCKDVPVLVAMVGKSTFSHNDKPNKWYRYDLGQSAAYISVQAMALGLYVHQMAGFEADQLKDSFSIPENFEAHTVLAIGYIGNADQLSADLRRTELAERKRRALPDLLFHERWAKPLL